MFQTTAVEKIKNILRLITFFSKSVPPFLGNVKKYCTAGQDRDDNREHAHFMLYT